MPCLSESDLHHLAAYDSKLQVVRERVIACANYNAPGLYCWGKPGTSKSHTIENTLLTMGTKYIKHTGNLSARSLVNELARYPNYIHYIEDIAAVLYSDKKAISVLLAACWGLRGKDSKLVRLVCWKTNVEQIVVNFTGALIFTSNEDLMGKKKQIDALLSRLNPLLLAPTDEEMVAMIHNICLKGKTLRNDNLHEAMHLSPGECWDVADHYIEAATQISSSLDLRTFELCLNDRIQWSGGDSSIHWKDMVRTRLARTIHICDTVEEKQILKEAEETYARELEGLQKTGLSAQEVARLWKLKTGKSKRSYYNCLQRQREDNLSDAIKRVKDDFEKDLD